MQKTAIRTLRCALCAAAVLGVAGASRRLVPLNPTTASLIMLLIVLAAASWWGFTESIFASLAGVLCFNYFFLPPVGTFTISDPENWVAFFAFLVTAVTASQLSASARQRAEEALSRRADIARLYELSRALLMEEGHSIRQAIVRASQVLGIANLMFFDRAAGQVYGTPEDSPFTVAELERVAISGEPLLLSEWSVVPVRLGSHVIGSLGLRAMDLSPEMRDSAASLLAINYERAMTVEKAAMAETARRGAEFRSSMLDALAHDLKTPLSAIRTCITHLISVPPRNEEVRLELLTIIDQESERLRVSLTEAIELARLESGTIEPEMADVPMEHLLPSREGRFTIDAPDGVSVHADASLLRRALGQVIENAVKYSPVESEIAIRVRQDGGEVVIAVLDRGPGIAIGDRKRVFEKFYRSEKWRDKVEGTGMGLPIAKAIIEAHGGRIYAEPRDGGGTAMTIRIPARAE